MLKRIYAVLVAGSIVAIQSLFATPSSVTNIQRIIKKNGKVIVIVRENGKNKEVILNQKDIEKITKESKNSNKKSSKKISKDKKRDSKQESIVKSKKNSSDSKQKSAKKSSNKAKKLTASKSKTYKVTSGDTVFSIARKFKVSISSIEKLNKLGNDYIIHPGDEIKIPSTSYIEAAKKAVENNKMTVYKVKRGDTLSVIAKNFNMTIEQIRKLNNLKRHPRLKPGMELNVIGKAKVLKERMKITRYQVKRGDTLWRISKRFGLTRNELKLLNPKLRRGKLKRGDILKVSKKEASRLAKLAKSRKKRLSGLLKRYQQRRTSYNSRGSRNVVAYAKRFLGVRYVWGATGRGGFDCSGFTQYVMRHAKGRTIPRVSRRQAYYGKYVSRRNLRAGDLIFFDTSRRRRGYVNHVGIYIGNGKFIHASSGKHRVVITSLNKPFYRSRFMWGRRVN